MSDYNVLDMSSGKRIQLDRSHVYIENKILHVMAVGDFNLENATRVKQIALEIQNAFGTLNALIDLNKAGKSSPEARKIWKELTELGNARVAFVGLHPVARVLASFTMAFSGNKNTVFFTSKNEALKWLKK